MAIEVNNTLDVEAVEPQTPTVPASSDLMSDPTLNIPEPPAKPKLSKGKMILIGAAGVLVILALLLTQVGKKQTTTTQDGATKSTVDLSRYAEDPDEDRIASFIESKLGFDPNVSELDRCFNSKCDSVDTAVIKAIPRNVMILLDSSGSMQQKVGDQSKMESAKIAIREYLKKTSQLESTSVGLIVYGHKGTNSPADKAASCQSAEILVPLGELNQTSAESVLAGVRPAGWTPIGLALQEAVKSFAVKQSAKPASNKQSPPPAPSKVINEVVIISDGVETCDTNPVQAAKELYESADNVVVHVIGFAVASTADNKSLRDISQVAGGTYATAPTIDELKLAMDLQWDNYVRRAREDACRVRGYETFLACKEDALALVNAYISSELSRDPRALPYEEKLKIDRIRYVFPGYINGTLDPLLLTAPSSTASASASPTPAATQ